MAEEGTDVDINRGRPCSWFILDNSLLPYPRRAMDSPERDTPSRLANRPRVERHDNADREAMLAALRIVLGLLVESSLASLIEQFPRFYQEHEHAVGGPTVTFNMPASSTLQTSNQKYSPVLISEEEERGFQSHRFKTRVGVYVTGRTEGRRGNVINVDDSEVILTDVPFRLFLRLVVALNESEDGFVGTGSIKEGGGLAEEGLYESEGLEQAISRLRTPFRTALGSTRPTEFVERKRGMIRLSTPRPFLAFDREELNKHSDATVRELAMRLPVPVESV